MVTQLSEEENFDGSFWPRVSPASATVLHRHRAAVLRGDGIPEVLLEPLEEPCFIQASVRGGAATRPDPRPLGQGWGRLRRPVGLWKEMARPAVFVKDVCAYRGPRESG